MINILIQPVLYEGLFVYSVVVAVLVLGAGLIGEAEEVGAVAEAVAEEANNPPYLSRHSTQHN
jgi:hypothetical protein